jgi:carboxypeptidase Taq
VRHEVGSLRAQEPVTDPLAELRERLATVRDLEAAAALLDWDQETWMPEGGTEARARQSATLHGLAHELFTADETATLLERARPESPVDADLVRVALRDLERDRRIPTDLVSDLARATSLAKDAWRLAREADDFAAFEPHLARIVALCVRKAEAVGFTDTPYDALVDEYEADMTAGRLATLFADLRRGLVPLIRTLGDAADASTSAVLHGRFPVDAQWTFGLDVLRDVGFDFRRGRQDRSVHPFTTAFSISDVRLTTRLNEDSFPPAFFSSLHEAGHGMYEQGMDPELDGTLLADGTSLGIHESQSRLWENQVGRSRPFWELYLPKLRTAFPEALAGIDLDAFLRAVNHVRPSPIRVEADEVTYNLHIMVRFELERALVEGRLRTRDVPEAWNGLMKEVLGVEPRSDAEGCLQDIHWSLGMFGYFPTYALGNLMSAQLWTAIRRDLPDVDGFVRRGEFSHLLDWLREHVHRHGRRRTADRILRDATGRGLSAADWLAYVRSKFGDLFGVDLAEPATWVRPES